MQKRQSSPAGHEFETFAPNNNAVLRIVVAYEDPATAQRVQRLFNRTALGLKRGGHGTVRCSMWKIAGPALTSRMKIAANKAKLADLIMIAAHERTMMPEVLQNWIGLWLPMKIKEPCGLIALLDRSTENDTRRGIHRYLKILAQYAKLSFFSNGSDGDSDEALQTIPPGDGAALCEPLTDYRNVGCDEAPNPYNRLDWNFYRESS